MTRRERGFSLVELMVVVAILGLAATAVVLTMRPSSGDVRAEASRFAARAALLRDTAIIEARPVRLWVAASGYGFEQRRGNTWTVASDRALAPRDWPVGVVVLANGAAAARVQFDRLGLPDSSLAIKLTRDGDMARVIIDAAGGVRVE